MQPTWLQQLSRVWDGLINLRGGRLRMQHILNEGRPQLRGCFNITLLVFNRTRHWGFFNADPHGYRRKLTSPGLDVTRFIRHGFICHPDEYSLQRGENARLKSVNPKH